MPVFEQIFYLRKAGFKPLFRRVGIEPRQYGLYDGIFPVLLYAAQNIINAARPVFCLQKGELRRICGAVCLFKFFGIILCKIKLTAYYALFNSGMQLIYILLFVALERKVCIDEILCRLIVFADKFYAVTEYCGAQFAHCGAVVIAYGKRYPLCPPDVSRLKTTLCLAAEPEKNALGDLLFRTGESFFENGKIIEARCAASDKIIEACRTGEGKQFARERTAVPRRIH